jgi:hypothetical protein
VHDGYAFEIQLSVSVMANVIFHVNDEPYCLWEIDLKEEVNRFLSGFDTGYFDYLLEVNLASEDEKRSAMALRIAYHHSMETLFSLLGALFQAPTAPHAWVARCFNNRLTEFVRRVSACDDSLPKGLSVQKVNWSEFAGVVLTWYRSGTERQRESIKLFAGLWTRLAKEFLDQNRIDEYNSLKHGFRVSGGSFTLHAGVEHTYGVPPPASEMQLVGSSEFGTTFRRLANASEQAGNRSLLVEQVRINWKIEKVAPLLQLISMSIANVIGTLKILNGVSPSEITFIRPESDEAFAAPWGQEPPVNNLVRRTQPGFDIPYLSKQDLLEAIRRGKRISSES